ncbi:TetR/AcrR family transcriptional regulator [Allorhizocola rhizosphaerae]|uniref:TetR/AcrR family transcriptional regulator n=1 Tax=Allorhizocola rhizosphaerae TaxID=1872709 RepID=UPI000E3CCBB6|nr:TetR/AcrR family transcriptional regulator [Allorhizocola rhizosphaerae]
MTQATTALPREDTRGRIQAVALELFTEQGYDKTSLREIAERLGVTKAALYYHFKSKEEIVESLTADHVRRMESLLDWARGRQPTPEFRREFVHRYMENLSVSQHFKVMKFIQQNQPSMKNMPNAAKWRESMQQMIDVLAGKDAGAVERMHVGLAIFGLHASWMLLPEGDYSEEERRQAALVTAYELLGLKS